MDRKLTTILAADVVGYSALMEADEAGTHERLKSSRKELFEPEIARHHGRVFKLMGDGMLAERNAHVADDRRIQVRIGINLGEVIVEGEDRYGEGVNIAARLEQLADPGGICVSAKVAKEVEKKLAFGFARDRQCAKARGMSHNPTTMDPRKIETLRAIMKALRTPETGCPWDLEQSFETIAPYTIEEAYEVADAIAKGSRVELCEELGDLLLQAVYHAQMADEEGSFTFDDVVEAVSAKMIRRHPHVFGDDEARSAKLAKGFWEEMKARERQGQPRRGVLDSVPLALPGLTRAVKLQARAAKVGFDWPSVDNVYDKIAEEVAEFRAAPDDKKAEEFGDILFAMANVARHLGIDPEAALRATNAKFERRFAHIEERLAEGGREPKDSGLTEMDALWDEAKRLGK